MEGTSSTYSENIDNPITMRNVMDAVELIESAMSKNPFHLLAKENGFDLSHGDKMVIPKGFAEAHEIKEDMCKGVILSDNIDCSIVFFRDDWDKINAR